MLEGGRRLLLVSGTDYGEAMRPLIFSRGDVLCGWNEPSLADVDGVPSCQVNAADAPQPRPLFDGVLTRVLSCELLYGPFNCEFVWGGSNQPILDEATLPLVSEDERCGGGASERRWARDGGGVQQMLWQLLASHRPLLALLRNPNRRSWGAGSTSRRPTC